MNSSETDPAVTAMNVLACRGHEIVVAENHIPRAGGLYAVHADPETWKVLGLEEREAGVPLYVGKSECDLLARDLNTHFAVGRGTKSRVVQFSDG